ncbi:MAG: hypothetical protein ACT4QD_15890 [Acidobacteriota bacterium]
MTCPKCRQRRGKRACPALQADICAICCGTKRLTEIACPSDCRYLETSQRHPAAAVKRQQEQDVAVLTAALGPLPEDHLPLFFALHSFIARYEPPAGTRLVDADLAEAATAIASSFETAGRGVLYEHTATSPTGEALRRQLTAFLGQIGRGGGSRFERAAAAVLRGMARGAAHEVAGLADGPVAYLTLVARITREAPPEARGPSVLLHP